MADEIPRTVCWFSAGAASAVATKITLAERENVVIAYTDPGSEHPDNVRFLDDCESWFGQEIIRLKSAVYSDTWDVWWRRKFILGHNGAPCTVELKRTLRYAFQRPTDIHVFGYTSEEKKRSNQFREQNPGVILDTPLITHDLGKADCLAMVARAGIELPTMYQLGYHNNNCIGCPKGGMGYWNKIRVDFPDAFDRMAKLERDLNYATHHDTAGPIWLDELDPERGDHDTEPRIDCSLLCALAEGVYEEAV